MVTKKQPFSHQNFFITRAWTKTIQCVRDNVGLNDILLISNQWKFKGGKLKYETNCEAKML